MPCPKWTTSNNDRIQFPFGRSQVIAIHKLFSDYRKNNPGSSMKDHTPRFDSEMLETINYELEERIQEDDQTPKREEI